MIVRKKTAHPDSSSCVHFMGNMWQAAGRGAGSSRARFTTVARFLPRITRASVTFVTWAREISQPTEYILQKSFSPWIVCTLDVQCAQLALRCITFPIHEIRCKWIRTLKGSKWAIYHQILTCENWDMATLVSWQECLETTFIEVFNNIWTHFWNLWNFLWTILPSVEPKYALL